MFAPLLTSIPIPFYAQLFATAMCCSEMTHFSRRNLRGKLPAILTSRSSRRLPSWRPTVLGPSQIPSLLVRARRACLPCAGPQWTAYPASPRRRTLLSRPSGTFLTAPCRNNNCSSALACCGAYAGAPGRAARSSMQQQVSDREWHNTERQGRDLGYLRLFYYRTPALDRRTPALEEEARLQESAFGNSSAGNRCWLFGGPGATPKQRRPNHLQQDTAANISAGSADPGVRRRVFPDRNIMRFSDM